ncbi:hypothetical protein [Methylobacterium sp. R2-1]|uniref:hypothetical protein n=1 Tax=Methylobacterium sp. R2-1 TaxID=2587064 RepID=UPI001620FBA5|nr:hypothetical protein [Methylobacterium sp. R2-1]MBB2963319.1 hypothetical protein [Methylobacterium sp. R2-1]
MQQIETPVERLGPLASVTLRPSAEDAFEAFVAPGDVFRHPREVLTYPGLTTAEKRVVLASWASDARAVESCPTMRCLPGCRAEPVPFDAVLAALQALDEGPIDRPEARGKPRLPFTVGSRGNREAASWRNGFH